MIKGTLHIKSPSQHDSKSSDTVAMSESQQLKATETSSLEQQIDYQTKRRNDTEPLISSEVRFF